MESSSKNIQRSSLKTNALSDRLRKRRCFADEELDRTIPLASRGFEQTSSAVKSLLEYPSSATVCMNRAIPVPERLLSKSLPQTVNQHQVIPRLTPSQVQEHKRRCSLSTAEAMRDIYYNNQLPKFEYTGTNGNTFQKPLLIIPDQTTWNGLSSHLHNLTAATHSVYNQNLNSHILSGERNYNISKQHGNKQKNRTTARAETHVKNVTTTSDLKFSISSILGLKE